VTIQSGIVNTTGSAGSVFVLGSNAAGGNGSGAGITISAGQGVGTGGSGNININAGGPALGSGAGTSVLLTAGGSTTGAAGKIACVTADTAGAGVPGSITFSNGRNTATGAVGTVGVLASGANFACHFAAQQSVAPAVDGVVATAIAAGSSDMAGRVTVQAAGVGTVTYNRPWAAGVVPFVVLTPFASVGTCQVTAATAAGFSLSHALVGGPMQINYMCIGPTHT
jgi:hypothetical protein